MPRLKLAARTRLGMFDTSGLVVRSVGTTKGRGASLGVTGEAVTVHRLGRSEGQVDREVGLDSGRVARPERQ